MALLFLKAIFSNIIVGISAFGFGTWILRFLPDSFSRLTRFVLATIAGFGILGIVLFCVGHISFSRIAIAIVVAIGIISAFINKNISFNLPINKFPAAIVGIVLAITAIGGLAEPVGDWESDGVAYHFVGPKVWLRDGIVRPVADNAPTSYPCTVEMIFAGLMAFGGDRAPGVSATWTLALFFAIAASLGRRCGLDRKSAWWIAALLAAMPALYEGSHSGFVDAIYAAFILAAIRVGLDAYEKKHFVVFGIFCGLAMATKYPALVAFPVLVICVVWPDKGRKNVQFLSNSLFAIVAGCAVAAPIYFRNWILLGSPIYPPPPSVANFLHVKYFSPSSLQDFYAWAFHRGNGHGRGIIHFFTLPYNLIYHAADFHGAGGIGLAPLALGPLGVLAAWREAFARRLACIGFVLLLLWFLTQQESRYLIHFFAISAIFSVLGWQFTISLSPKHGKILCAVVIAISVAYGIFMIGKARISDMRSVISRTYASERRQHEVPFVESFDFLNHDASVTRVLLLDRSIPAYYSDKNYVKPFGQWGEQVFPDISTPDQTLKKLNELQISHILDVQSTISDFQVPPNIPGLALVFERPGQKIYKVMSRQ